MPLQEPKTPEEALAMGWTVRVGDDGKKRAFDERTDDQRALLDASYQWDTDPKMSDRADADSPGGVFSAEGPIAFFNRGINRTATLGAGTNWLDKASRAMRINIPEREPEGFIERGAQGAGMAFGSIPPVASIAGRMALGAGKYIPEIGRAISAPFMRTPVAAVTAEAASGLGAGMGEELTGPEYGTMGNIVGGVGGAIGANAWANASPIANPTRMHNMARRVYDYGSEAVREGLLPFSKAGAPDSAGRQLAIRLSDVDDALDKVKTPSPYGSGPFEQTGSEELMALQRELASRDVASSEALSNRLSQTQSDIHTALTDLADTGGLEGRIVSARERADETIRNLGPRVSREEASDIYRREVQAAHDDARTLESELWNIPDSNVSTENLMAENARQMNAEKALLKYRPQLAQDLLARLDEAVDGSFVPSGALGDTESYKEIHAFASQMRRISRAALANNDPQQARFARELGDAAWKDLMGSADLPTQASPQLRAAREYSLAMKKTFNQGAVKDILGYERDGGLRTQGTETLDAILGNRGDAGARITNDQLMAAVGFPSGPGRHGDTGARAIQDYITHRFLAKSISANDTYSAQNARTFIKDNEALLNRHPDVLASLESAAQDMTNAEGLRGLGKSISSVMKSSSPLDDFRALSQKANIPDYNKSAGSALMEFSLYGSGALDASGNRQPNADRLLGFINSDKTRPVFQEVFSSPQLERLETLATELSNSQKASGPLSPTIAGDARPLPTGISRIRGSMTFWARAIGAGLGSRASRWSPGGSLATASLGSTSAKSAIKDIMNQPANQVMMDAMNDHELFAALLTKTNAPAQEAESALKIIREYAKNAPQAIREALIPSAEQIDRYGMPMSLGTGAAMMPDRDQRRTPPRTVDSIDPLPGNSAYMGTMADILPSLNDRIQSGQTLTGDPLARR